jgi:hypothetical protein
MTTPEDIIKFVNEKTPKTSVKLNNVKCQMTIDTGASVNIIDETTYKRLSQPTLKKKQLTKCLFPYGSGQPLRVIGRCDLLVETSKKIQSHEFYIVPGDHGSLLGYPTSIEFDLIAVLNNITDSHLKNENLFKGIGKLRDTTLKLHIDETVKPVAQKQRRTTFHLRDKVANEIEKLLKEDVIEKVEDTPTPWVSSIVTPPKKEPGAISLCVGMREPNKAIQRERHQMPTIDELINDLNGAKVFSKLDLRTGYHQLELHEDSRYITTFSTHIGLYRYKRLNFGICSASTADNVIRDIPGAKNIADDIIIFGTNQKQHDIALDILNLIKSY